MQRCSLCLCWGWIYGPRNPQPAINRTFQLWLIRAFTGHVDCCFCWWWWYFLVRTGIVVQAGAPEADSVFTGTCAPAPVRTPTRAVSLLLRGLTHGLEQPGSECQPRTPTETALICPPLGPPRTGGGRRWPTRGSFSRGRQRPLGSAHRAPGAPLHTGPAFPPAGLRGPKAPVGHARRPGDNHREPWAWSTTRSGPGVHPPSGKRME